MGGMRRTSMRRIGAIAVIAVMTLAACGSDGDDDDAAASTTTASDSGDGDAADFLGECTDFSEAFVGAGAAIGSAFSGAGDELDEVASYFKEVASRVPKEIRGDFEVFAKAYASFAEAAADANIDFSDPSSIDASKLADLEKLSDAFSSSEVEEASANIEAYFEANC